MIHDSAFIDENVKIGKDSYIWHNSQIRKNVKIGKNCIIGKNVFIDHDVKIGDNCKIQNNVSIFFDAELENGVFIGPHVCFTNDLVPRAIKEDGSVKSSGDWKPSKTLIKKGASVGANSTLLPGIKLGEWVMVGAGSVVTKDFSAHSLVVGVPAKLVGHVCFCGQKLDDKFFCKSCNKKIDLK